MFMQKLKDMIFKPQELITIKEDRLIDSGLIAICIIFMQFLVAVERPDIYQIVSLVLFAIAIPMLAIHFFITQMFYKVSIFLPACLVNSIYFLLMIGLLSTPLGIAFALFHSSMIVSLTFIASSALAMTLICFIQRDILRVRNYVIEEKREEERQNLSN